MLRLFREQERDQLIERANRMRMEEAKRMREERDEELKKKALVQKAEAEKKVTSSPCRLASWLFVAPVSVQF